MNVAYRLERAAARYAKVEWESGNEASYSSRMVRQRLTKFQVEGEIKYCTSN